MDRQMCVGCVHVIPIPDDCHIGCNNPKAKPERTPWNGSGVWPLNFDSATVKSCDGYSKDTKDRKPLSTNPLLELFRLLR